MTGMLTAGRQPAQDPRLTAEARALRMKFPSRTAPGRWKATCQDRQEVLTRLLAPPFALENPGGQRSRRRALIGILDWLQAQSGQTWQDRWNASGVDTGGRADSDWKSAPVAWLKQTGHIAPAVPPLMRLMPPFCFSFAVMSSAPAFPGF